jgi:hypothetical protein
LPEGGLSGRNCKDFQVATMRAHSRARAVSLMPGNRPAKLHGGRELASAIEGGADRRSLGLIDDDHAGRMGT